MAAQIESSAVGMRLVLSAPVAAYVPSWYMKQAVQNWIDFTVVTTYCVLHVDRARRDNLSALSDSLWQRRAEGDGLPRVLINPLRLYTARRTGSILAAHMHNFAFAQRTIKLTHFLFLAHNCFFIRPGVEEFVAIRDASTAIRACPEPHIRVARAHCTTLAWFNELNAHRTTARKLLVEGQFFPAKVLDWLLQLLRTRDPRGRPLAPVLPPTMN